MTAVPPTSALSPPSALLAGFVYIGPRTTLYSPPKPVPGELVIICTWLGASRKHIAKYTTLYQRVAPGARILLIESNVPILVSSYARQARHIQSAVAAVIDTLGECRSHDGSTNSSNNDLSSMSDKETMSSTSWDTLSPSPKIVLHAFSNGGANTATQLLLNLQQSLTSIPYLPSSIPICGIVLDSCPAKGTYWKSYNAMVLSLPKDVASKIIGALAVHILLTMLYTWIACGNENPASLMRRTLLNDDIVKGLSEEEEGAEMQLGRLCYLYSKEDKMVEWTDITDHAEDAESRGWVVEEECFNGSAHCAHISADAERYANAVERVWNRERKAQSQKLDNKIFKTKL